MKKYFIYITTFLIATCLWLFPLSFIFAYNIRDYRDNNKIGKKAQKIANRHIKLWESKVDQSDIKKMRITNAEWDFMGRTFLVLALANMIEVESAKREKYLKIIDTIIDDTIELYNTKGLFYFLMGYAKSSPFEIDPPRSIFIDGEIALMLGIRRLIQEDQKYEKLMKELVETMVERMKISPVLSGESYPNECWIFCNTIAIASIKIYSILDNNIYDKFINNWLKVIKEKLIDPKTGLLYSSYSIKGNPYQGPEGTSIWLSAHMLQIIDSEFAFDQYLKAKKELGRSIFGFGYAKEWPDSFKGFPDVDSGPVIPLLDASVGSSGLAVLGATAFDDYDYFKKLLASLNFAAFPIENKESIKFCASNQVGDAVILYAMVNGPLWKKILSMEKEKV